MTSARPSIAERAVTTWHHWPLRRPRSAASSGETSRNISGISSFRYGVQRLIPPAVWCSVTRNVVNTNGNTAAPAEPGGGW